jgi:hypothetical protein
MERSAVFACQLEIELKIPPTKGQKDRADRDLSVRVKIWNLADRHTPERNVLLCCLIYGSRSGQFVLSETARLGLSAGPCVGSGTVAKKDH